MCQGQVRHRCDMARTCSQVQGCYLLEAPTPTPTHLGTTEMPAWWRGPEANIHLRRVSFSRLAFLLLLHKEGGQLPVAYVGGDVGGGELMIAESRHVGAFFNQQLGRPKHRNLYMCQPTRFAYVRVRVRVRQGSNDNGGSVLTHVALCVCVKFFRRKNCRCIVSLGPLNHA